MEVTIDSEDVKDIVEAQIQLAIVKELGNDPEQVMAKIVGRAMAAKKNDYRGEPTIFGAQVEAMIREAAQEQFKVWLDDNKALLKKAITARLKKNPQAFVNNLADTVCDAIVGDLQLTARLKSEDW